MPSRVLMIEKFDDYLKRYSKEWHSESVWVKLEDVFPHRLETGVNLCRRCLEFIPEPLSLARHEVRCNVAAPTGILAYEEGNYRFYLVEPEGPHHNNLFKLSKMLFKRMKNLKYSKTWKFCILTIKEKENGYKKAKEKFVGFFTKPTKRIVLADLMILPNYQTNGLEQFMIDFAYLLGVFDGQDLFTYKNLTLELNNLFLDYWERKIYTKISSFKKSVDIEVLRKSTRISLGDIITTLNHLDEVFRDDNGNVLIKYDRKKYIFLKPLVAKYRHLNKDIIKKYKDWVSNLDDKVEAKDYPLLHKDMYNYYKFMGIKFDTLD